MMCSHRSGVEYDCEEQCGDFMFCSLHDPDRVPVIAPKTTSAIKQTNPKDAIGAAKASTWYVPSRVLMEVGVAMLEGARKYGPFNWRKAGVCASVYIGAVDRHLTAWKEGEDIDPASGLSHITKAISSLTVLRDSMLEGNWVDDRPPAVKIGWVEQLSELAARILERYPTVKP